MKELIKRRLPGLFGLSKRTYYRLRRLNPFISRQYLYVGQGQYLDFKRFRKREIKPNLFIIGAEKSGTTSLHHYLDQHPDIFMAKPNKEAQYLLDFQQARIYYHRANMPIRNRYDILKNHVLRGYLGERIIGESSTSYTRGRVPIKMGVLKRIKDYSPQPKLIYIVRHPLERIISNYLHARRERQDTGTLEAEINKKSSYLKTSLYGHQLKKYLEVAPNLDCLVIFYRDLIHNGQETLGRITGFLGVENFEFKLDEAYNVAENKQHFSPKQLLFNHKDYKRLMKKVEPDIKLLEKLTGQKVSWKFDESEWVR